MKSLCKIDGCGKPVHGHGFCSAHYERMKRHGDPLAGRTSPGALLAWIEQHKTHVGKDCLQWPFRTGGRGDAVLTVDGRDASAARYMCILVHGEPPTPRHHAAHSCGKGHEACINPDHLSWKTPKENQADRLAHGTEIRGENSKQAKLTATQVADIIAAPGSHSAIAARHGVGRRHISKIKRKETWSWLA